MDQATPDFLSDGRLLFVFLIATVLMGGSAAWLTGRAIAAAWQPWWHVVMPMLLLGLAVRFIHYAVFRSAFLSPRLYLIDTAVCLVFGLLGFRLMRVRQMVTRYDWINERSGALGWRRRAP